MTNEDRNKIIEFVDNAISDDEINYKKEIKEDCLIIKIDSFFNTKKVIYNFKVINKKVHFYSSNNKNEIATEQLFFDEMISQCQNEIM